LEECANVKSKFTIQTFNCAGRGCPSALAQLKGEIMIEKATIGMKVRVVDPGHCWAYGDREKGSWSGKIISIASPESFEVKDNLHAYHCCTKCVDEIKE
jgi:hypothetical protein